MPSNTPKAELASAITQGSLAASVLLFLCLLPGFAAAGTFVDSDNGNFSAGTSQPIGQTPMLLLYQNAKNTSLAQAQPVSPQYQASEVLGSLDPSHTTPTYAFNVNAGSSIDVYVTAQDPATQFTELLLYDNNGNLVAIAAGNEPDGSSSVIQYTVPSGDAGAWTVEVVNAMGESAPGFNYSLRLLSPIVYRTVVRGSLKSGLGGLFYAVAVEGSDSLHFNLSAGSPGTKKPELLLYDNNRNLVAVAAGNASDGSSCTIDFTVPANSAGTWYVEVTRANAAQDNFAYGLVIQGATGVGPLNPIDPKE
jgi:hypothetical protein